MSSGEALTVHSATCYMAALLWVPVGLAVALGAWTAAWTALPPSTSAVSQATANRQLMPRYQHYSCPSVTDGKVKLKYASHC